jgi:hypothetical protein
VEDGPENKVRPIIWCNQLDAGTDGLADYPAPAFGETGKIGREGFCVIVARREGFEFVLL